MSLDNLRTKIRIFFRTTVGFAVILLHRSMFRRLFRVVSSDVSRFQDSSSLSVVPVVFKRRCVVVSLFFSVTVTFSKCLFAFVYECWCFHVFNRMG